MKIKKLCINGHNIYSFNGFYFCSYCNYKEKIKDKKSSDYYHSMKHKEEADRAKAGYFKKCNCGCNSKIIDWEKKL